MEFTYEVYVNVERVQGKFAARDDIGEAIRSAIEEGASMADVSGLDVDGSSEYEITDSTVDEAFKPKAKPRSKVYVRLTEEFAKAAEDAAKRFPKDYDAALRYARDLVSEEGA